MQVVDQLLLHRAAEAAASAPHVSRSTQQESPAAAPANGRAASPADAATEGRGAAETANGRVRLGRRHHAGPPIPFIVAVCAVTTGGTTVLRRLWRWPVEPRARCERCVAALDDIIDFHDGSGHVKACIHGLCEGARAGLVPHSTVNASCAARVVWLVQEKL